MTEILYYIEKANNIVNSIVWGPPILAFFIIIGLYFSVKLKFFQVTKIKLWLQKTVGSLFSKNHNKSKNGISPFEAAMTVLAGAIGTGNVVGVATAITLGGPGSIFWMWVASILGMMTIFAENILGVKYRKQSSNGEFVGGPMYYIEKGLKCKWLAIIFSIMCIFASFGIGNMTQINAIAVSMQTYFNVPPILTGVTVAVIVGSVIFGGLNRIASVTSKIVPFMAIFYVVGGLVVIISNHEKIPYALSEIFKGAFGINSVCAGSAGYLAKDAIKYGIARGFFSNEAGLGSSPMVHASADTDDPIVQGMWGIFQVFVDTIVVCSITALCILTTGVHTQIQDGAMMSVSAFSCVFGNFGEIFVSLSIVMFAFATLISWAFYGERSVEYISSKNNIVIYRSVYLVVILFGAVMELNLVWSISDTFNALMAIPNLVAVVFLSKEVINSTKSKYFASTKNKTKAAVTKPKPYLQ